MYHKIHANIKIGEHVCRVAANDRDPYQQGKKEFKALVKGIKSKHNTPSKKK